MMLNDDFCALQNVTYDHRVYNPDDHNWCPVPGGGADALLFAGLAVLIGCLLYSRLSAVWVLLAGAGLQLLSFSLNLGHLSNAISLWLGMRPSTMFFQIFLPPLLLDSAVRVDFFLFKKMVVHVLFFAFVNVVVSTLAFIPLMLYGLNLAAAGWRPVDAALFGAMLGSTDAVAVTAILKAGGAPEMLSVLLEGESLFNDASSIVLFEIFLHLSMSEGGSDVSLRESFWHIVSLIGYLASTGAAAGLVMGVLTSWLYKLLSRRHVPPAVEVAVSLAGAYTVYLGTEYYIHGSGVIAVVVYGLYGAATFLYGFSSKGMRQDAFFKFWDVVSFSINGMVFFFVGTSVMHFMLNLAGELFQGGTSAALLLTLQTLPGIIAAMFALRWLLMTLEAPLLSLVGPALSWQEVLFSALGGLRGGLALILVQTVIAGHGATKDSQLKVIHAEMAIWISGVVLFTLTVNAPGLGPLMTALGLNKVTPAQRHMHRRAYAALAAFTKRTVEELQVDDDEMLKGVDWTAVVAGADLCLGKAAKKVLRSSNPGEPPSKTLAHEHQAADQPPHSNDRYRSSQLSAQLSSLLDYEEYNTQSNTDGRGADGGPAGLGGQTPESPKPQVLTRASLERSSLSFAGVRGLNVPLLSRQYSGGRGAAERYSSLDDADSASEEGDVEAPVHQDVPQVVAESSSEAVFIASRLMEQDEQIAKHAAEAADCPFLARTKTGSSSDGDAIGEAAAAAAAAAAEDASNDGSYAQLEQQEEEEEANIDNGDDNGTGDDRPAGEQDVDTSDNPPAAELAKPKFKLLSPLVVLRMTDALNNNSTMQPHAVVPLGHLHGPEPPATAAAAVGTTAAAAAAAGEACRCRHNSFISAAAAVDSGGGYGNSVRVAALQRRAAAVGGSGRSFSGGSGGSFVGSGMVRRSSVRLLSSVWQQHSARQMPHGGNTPSRLSIGASWESQQQREDCSAAIGAAATVGAAAGSGFAASCMVRDFDHASEYSEDDEDEMTEEEYLEECRVTLLAGLKRHFRFKAAEGLLSKTGLRLLDYACDACLSKPGQPLNMWSTIGHDFKRRGLTAATAALLFQLRRYQTALLRTQTGGGSSFLLSWMLHGPVNGASVMLRNRLGNVSLTVLEVALELWLALTASPQARMTRQSRSNTSGILQEELKQQADAVWRFIMDRQIEAPDEFASLQTHRLQLAVARRQLAFVEQLAEVGALEESAAEALQELVEHRLHKLEARGPSWRSPSLTDVLRRQPFLAGEDESMLLWLRAYGELKSYSPGQCMVPRRRSGPPGIFIVLSGLVRVEVVHAGQHKTHFVGVGGSVGFISSLLGKELPGVGLAAAFAQGNALGRGPLVLHLPMRLLATIRQRAAPAIQQQHQPPHTWSETPTAAYTDVDAAPQSLNAAAFAQLLLDMHRQAGIMLLDRMGSSVGQRLAAHIEGAVQAIFEYVSQLPPSKASSKLQRLLEALLGSNSGIAASDMAAEPSYYNSANTSLPAAAAAAAAGAKESDMAGHGAAFLSDSEAAMQLVAERAAAAAALLRELLRTADLVTLTAGQQIAQTSTMLLLNGCLRLHSSSNSSGKHTVDTAAAGSAPAAGAGGAAGVSNALRQFNAPTLIAWAPELFESLEDRYNQQPPLYTAGPRGALLLITPSTWDGSSGVSPGEQLQEQQGLAPAGAADLVGGGTGQQRQRRQQQQVERLSSVMPLHKTSPPVLGQDQDDV